MKKVLALGLVSTFILTNAFGSYSKMDHKHEKEFTKTLSAKEKALHDKEKKSYEEFKNSLSMEEKKMLEELDMKKKKFWKNKKMEKKENKK